MAQSAFSGEKRQVFFSYQTIVREQSFCKRKTRKKLIFRSMNEPGCSFPFRLRFGPRHSGRDKLPRSGKSAVQIAGFTGLDNNLILRHQPSIPRLHSGPGPDAMPSIPRLHSGPGPDAMPMPSGPAAKTRGNTSPASKRHFLSGSTDVNGAPR